MKKWLIIYTGHGTGIEYFWNQEAQNFTSNRARATEFVSESLASFELATANDYLLFVSGDVGLGRLSLIHT